MPRLLPISRPLCPHATAPWLLPGQQPQQLLPRQGPRPQVALIAPFAACVGLSFVGLGNRQRRCRGSQECPMPTAAFMAWPRACGGFSK